MPKKEPKNQLAADSHLSATAMSDAEAGDDTAAKPSMKQTKAKEFAHKTKTPLLSQSIPASEAPDVEDAEDEEEQASASERTASSHSAALAAASGGGEMSASFKNFRHHPDMENFYRFIYENDLRHEALMILDSIMAEKLAKKPLKNK